MCKTANEVYSNFNRGKFCTLVLFLTLDPSKSESDEDESDEDEGDEDEGDEDESDEDEGDKDESSYMPHML